MGGTVKDISEDIPFEIPDSWQWVHLPEIAHSELGKTLDQLKNTGDFEPYLCSINVVWGKICLDKVKVAKFEGSEKERYALKNGDLLICEGGDAGRAAVWDLNQKMYYQNALHRVRFYCNINPYFYSRVIEIYKAMKLLDEYCKGVTIKHLVQSALHSLYLPLPPISEQNRIVAKIEELFKIIDAKV